MENKERITALYIRGNNEQQIKEQKEKLKEYCEKLEIKNYSFYIDKRASGLDKNRIALKRLERDIEDKRIEQIIAKHLGKLSRDKSYIEQFFVKCIKHHVEVRTLDGLMLSKLMKEQYEIVYKKILSRKIKKGIKFRKKKENLDEVDDEINY